MPKTHFQICGGIKLDMLANSGKYTFRKMLASTVSEGVQTAGRPHRSQNVDASQNIVSHVFVGKSSLLRRWTTRVSLCELSFDDRYVFSGHRTRATNSGMSEMQTICTALCSSMLEDHRDVEKWCDTNSQSVRIGNRGSVTR